MLESLTIFSSGGLILYQYCAQPSLVGASDGPANTKNVLNNHWIQKVLLASASGSNSSSRENKFHIADGLTFVWMPLPQQPERYVVAVYPDIMFEGPRQYLKQWAKQLLPQVVSAYDIYCREHAEETMSSNIPFRPDPTGFDPIFRKLLESSKNAKQTLPATTSDASSSNSNRATTSSNANAKKGKEKRNWHDGNAKVTDKAMAELDMSKSTDNDATSDAAQARALQEAREAYLPTAAELEASNGSSATTSKDAHSKSSNNSATNDATAPPSWSASLTGAFQQLTGNKILTPADLELPLQQVQELLASKNVATEIAQEMCDTCRTKLVGKRLNSLYRVQTAVQQALAARLEKLLEQSNQVDLVRNIMRQRGDGGAASLFSSLSGSKKRPYVICVMGINGIGKTTSLAKLAYYFSKHGNCKPLLVAGDTFRSGAVEQLKVHATCLNVPMFSQGYSKDPSSVAKAAIAHATAEGNDVVLIDTAGRMQNNVPLMKALGKLVQENQPDFVIMVCEALVGHDGLSQYKMFEQALGPRQKIDGLILTKFDTVADKVGAALTLTHETNTPIVFCGTGQKYHHLKTLSVPEIIQSLFS